MYAIKVEATSPSGVGIEWTHSHGWTNKGEAERETDFHNRHYKTDIIDGAVWDIYWAVRKED